MVQVVKIAAPIIATDATSCRNGLASRNWSNPSSVFENSRPSRVAASGRFVAEAVGSARCLSSTEAATGTTSTETISDRTTAALIANAMSPKSWPASSFTKSTGRNTATVVSVLASTAPQTSPAP